MAPFLFSSLRKEIETDGKRGMNGSTGRQEKFLREKAICVDDRGECAAFIHVCIYGPPW